MSCRVGIMLDFYGRERLHFRVALLRSRRENALATALSEPDSFGGGWTRVAQTTLPLFLSFGDEL